jgi:hypothetical protein
MARKLEKIGAMPDDRVSGDGLRGWSYGRSGEPKPAPLLEGVGDS